VCRLTVSAATPVVEHLAHLFTDPLAGLFPQHARHEQCAIVSVLWRMETTTANSSGFGQGAVVGSAAEPGPLPLRPALQSGAAGRSRGGGSRTEGGADALCACKPRE
jgi:hypothetical protein